MIKKTWLSSYPRSGNTFTRVLLNESFGVSVGSKYEEDYSNFSKSFSDLLGYGKENKFWIVKTHEIEDANDPAIYVVRDGRSCVVSYYHYCQKFEMDRTIEDIIAGRTPFGSWSAHYRGWDPMNRPATLFLRFEDIVTEPADAVRRIGDFLGVAPLALPQVSFDSLNRSSPDFFRSGSDSNNIAELDERAIALFDELHGDVMRELGYYP